MSADQNASKKWWGDFTVTVGRALHWRLGPLSLWIERRPGEWRVTHKSSLDPEPASSSDDCVVALETDPASIIDADVSIDRYAVAGEASQLALAVSSPDRPMVSCPDAPFHVPPGGDVGIYVGSPLWFQIAVPKASGGMLLVDRPIQRLSDTWFGPTTHDGELCYASRTGCRLSIDDVPRLLHRAVTAVRLINRGVDTLHLDRLKLPVETLALYVADDGRIWTQDLTLESHGTAAPVQVSIERKPPRAAGRSARRLSEARQVEPRSAVMRAFGSLFS